MVDMATPLLSLAELALWAQRPAAEVEADPFAAEVISKVSDLARFLGGHEEWEAAGPEKAPFDVLMVVLQVSRRCYVNPSQVVAEGSVGPIGGDRVLDVAALLLSLTDTERAVLTKYNPIGDPDAVGNGLFTIQTTRGDETTLSHGTLYVGDDQQVGLETSDDPREWMIPMFSPLDPGSPDLYDSEEG